MSRNAVFHDIEFDLALSGDMPDVKLNPNQMHQVFLNLIINAVEAIGNTSNIRIHSRTSPDEIFMDASVRDEGKLKERI